MGIVRICQEVHGWKQRGVGNKTMRGSRQERANVLAADEPQPNYLVLPASEGAEKLGLQAGGNVVGEGDCYHGAQLLKVWLLQACTHHQPTENVCHLEFPSISISLHDPAIMSTHTIRPLSSLPSLSSNLYLQAILHRAIPSLTPFSALILSLSLILLSLFSLSHLPTRLSNQHVPTADSTLCARPPLLHPSRPSFLNLLRS